MFGPNLDKLRQAKTLDVSLMLEGRELSILSCQFADMQRTLADLTDRASTSMQELQKKRC